MPTILPFVALLAFLIVLPFIMSHPSHYVEVFRTAKENNDDATTTIALRRLIHEYPNSNTYRYELATQYFKADDYLTAIGLLNAMAPISEDKSGFGPAHLNLVELADDENVDFTMNPDRRIFHLRKAFEADPKNVTTNRLLGLGYLAMQQPRLAEPHLAKICGGSPELLFHFANLESQLGKNKEAIIAAKQAGKLISKRVAQQPNNVEARALKAKIMLTLGRGDEAEKELVELYRARPDATRLALSEFSVMYARQMFAQSIMYRDNAAQMVGRALQLEPDSVTAAEFLVELAQAGASVPERTKRQLSTYWEDRCVTAADDASVLATCARVNNLSGNKTQAINRIRAAAKIDPQHRDELVTMLVNFDRSDEAKPILADLRKELQPQIASDSSGNIRLRLARLEQLTGNHENVISLLDSIEQPSLSVRRHRVRAVVDASRSLPVDQCLDQLENALTILPTDARLLSRISSLAQQHPEQQQRCRQIILDHVVEGQIPAWRAYAAFGTAAIVAENFDEAIADLNESVRLSKRDRQNADPITLNNLASANIRCKKPNFNAGLTAIDNALEILPQQTELLTTRGEVLVVGGKWEAAVETLNKVISRKPGNLTAHSLLAKAYRGLGNTEMARLHEEKLMENRSE